MLVRQSLSRQLAPSWPDSQNILDAIDQQVRALKLNEVATVNSNRLSRITRKVEMEQSVEKIIERNLLEVFNARDADSRRGNRRTLG
jgi:hypothetical protein